MTAPTFDSTWAAHKISLKAANPDEFLFATYILDRLPKFKIHRTIGHARSAISQRVRYRDGQMTITADCALYQRNNAAGTWDPVHTFLRGHVYRRMPWQTDPGPQEQRAADDHLRWLNRAVDNVADSARQMSFDPATYNQLVGALLRFKTQAIEIIQDQA